MKKDTKKNEKGSADDKNEKGSAGDSDYSESLIDENEKTTSDVAGTSYAPRAEISQQSSESAEAPGKCGNKCDNKCGSKEKENEKSASSCCGGGGGRGFWLCMAVTVVLIAAEYLISAGKIEKFSETVKKEIAGINDLNRKEHEFQLMRLYTEIGNLRKKIAEFQSKIAEKSEKKYTDLKSLEDEKKITMREKWKIWSALKAKMESGETCEPELQEFYAAFSDDPELIALVKDLAGGIDMFCCSRDSSSENYNGTLGVCRKYFKKIIRIRKIDNKKLADISGYVLSSVNNTKNGDDKK